jgi:hypothetical protein
MTNKLTIFLPVSISVDKANEDTNAAHLRQWAEPE